MAASIVIYGPGGAALRSVPLLGVLQLSMERNLGRSLGGARLKIVVFGVPDVAMLDGDPVLINLCPEFGYARVYVEENGVVTYNHPHRVQEILGAELQRRLEGSGKIWGYHLLIDGMPSAPAAVGPLEALSASLTAGRATPAVEGSIAVSPYAPGQGPAFRIRKVEEPDPPLASIEDFPIVDSPGDRQAFVKVLVPERLSADLLDHRPFSSELEEGGFLVGQVFRDREVEGTFLLVLAAAIEAENTGASLLHFTYTGDSFTAMRRVLREQYPKEELLGWFHTHLFAATQAMGLSSIDLELHFTTFRRPWQLAGLINMDGKGPRVLRFYVRQAATMVPCPQWILR